MNITDEQYLYAVKLKNKTHPFPCALYDKNGSYFFINRAFEVCFGVKSEQVLGKSILSLESNVNDFVGVIDAQNKHVMNTKEHLFSLNIVPTTSGTEAFYVSKRPLINALDEVVGVDVSMFNTGFIFSLFSSFNDPRMYQEQGNMPSGPQGLCDCFTPLQETYAYFIMCGFSNDAISTILNKSIKTVENNMSRLFDKAQLCYSPYINSRREFRDYLLRNKITNLSPAGTMETFIKTLTTVPSNLAEAESEVMSQFLLFSDFGKVG